MNDKSSKSSQHANNKKSDGESDGEKSPSILDSMLEKVASLFVPTLDRKELPLSDEDIDNMDTAPSDHSSGEDLSVENSSDRFSRLQSEKSEAGSRKRSNSLLGFFGFGSKRDDHTVEDNYGGDSSTSNQESQESSHSVGATPSSLPNSSTSGSLQYLNDYFMKHRRRSDSNTDKKGNNGAANDDEKKRRTSSKNVRENVGKGKNKQGTSLNEIDDFLGQVSDLARETFENTRAHFIQKSRESSVNPPKKQTLSKEELEQERKENTMVINSLVLLSLEIDKVKELERLNQTGELMEDKSTLLFNVEPVKPSGFSYSEFASDLNHVKTLQQSPTGFQDQENGDYEDKNNDSFSVIGNAEIAMERESQYPSMQMPYSTSTNNDVDSDTPYYHRPGNVNRDLYNQLRGEWMRNRL